MAAESTRADQPQLAEDVGGFSAAVAGHVPQMSRLAARLAGSQERDDVVQQALLLAWRHRRQFDPQRGSLSAWLLKITAREATRIRRRLSRQTLRQATDRAADIDRDLDLEEALKQLTPRERLAVDCFYFADLSISATAAVMSCSDGTVKSTLALARQKLRKALE